MMGRVGKYIKQQWQTWEGRSACFFLNVFPYTHMNVPPSQRLS